MRFPPQVVFRKYQYANRPPLLPNNTTKQKTAGRYHATVEEIPGEFGRSPRWRPREGRETIATVKVCIVSGISFTLT